MIANPLYMLSSILVKFGLVWLTGWVLSVMFIKFLEGNPQKRGEKYENTIAQKLSEVFGVPVYTNLIPNKISDEELTEIMNETNDYYYARSICMSEAEIDMAFVTTKGIFCIECKSRQSGYTMFGSLNHDLWEVSMFHGPSERIMNPFNQNYKHVKTLDNVGLVPSNLVYNIVITNANYEFTYCGVKKENRKEPFINMMNRNEMKALVWEGHGGHGIKAFKKAVDELPDLFSKEDVEGINKELKSYEATKAERKAHARHMQGVWDSKKRKKRG